MKYVKIQNQPSRLQREQNCKSHRQTVCKDRVDISFYSIGFHQLLILMYSIITNAKEVEKILGRPGNEVWLTFKLCVNM